MELKNLMSGIAVVIDDKLENDVMSEDDEDPIVEIVKQLEREWNLPFYKATEMPPEEIWPNLLQAASFILLDWKLWPIGASQLEQKGIKENIRFLESAKEYLVPVFIFTNEKQEDIENKLPQDLYHPESPETNFIFIRQKIQLLSHKQMNFQSIEYWLKKNASVYALKTWEQIFHAAKKDLFSSMYARSPDWPKVFWKAYEEDGVDPSWSLTHLINDNLQGRMRMSAFENDVLSTSTTDVSKEDLQKLIGETSFIRREVLPEDEIGCGDLFGPIKGKFLLNLRPDCDCIPRDRENADDVELYCIEGSKINDAQLRAKYQEGFIQEKIWESIIFAIHEGKSLQFSFKKLRIKTFACLKAKRIGRLLHPYLTRIQQRYALYQQRQGLPRIPQEAIPPKP